MQLWTQSSLLSTQTVKSFCRMTQEKMLMFTIMTFSLIQTFGLPSWLLTTRRNLRLSSANMTSQSKRNLQVQPWPWLLKMMSIGARWHWQTKPLFWMKIRSKLVFSGFLPVLMQLSRDCRTAITPWQKPEVNLLLKPMERRIKSQKVLQPLRWPMEQLPILQEQQTQLTQMQQIATSITMEQKVISVLQFVMLWWEQPLSSTSMTLTSRNPAESTCQMRKWSWHRRKVRP